MSSFESGDVAALINRPARVSNGHSTIARPRLIRLLDTGAASALCIVRGPRNQGKSIALSQWAAHTEREILWLHLTADSATPDIFWEQLHTALHSKFSAPSRSSIEAQEPPSPSINPAQELAANINGSGPFTLILEDFYWAHDSPMQDGLIELLNHAPALNIIVAARSPLDVESDYASYTTDFYVVGPDSLQFTAAEAAQFHAGTVLEPISSELNERLHRSPILHKSAKFAAAESRKNSVDLVDDIVQKITASLHQQVKTHLILPQDDALRGFMAATVQLMHFDLELAQAVVPACDDPKALIRKLVETGALRSSPHNGAIRYSYPSLVTDILTGALPADIAVWQEATLATAAALEFDRGCYLQAFVYATTNGNYSFSSNIILSSGLALLLDVPATFIASLESIPYTQIAKYPLLSLALGLNYSSDKSTRLKGAEYFALALAASKVPGRAIPAQERLALGMVQVIAQRLTGQFKLSAATARNCLKDRSELPLTSRDQLAAFESVALAQWGLSLILTDDYTAATRALHQAVSVGQAAGSQKSIYFATSLLAYRYAIDGDLSTAAEFAQSAQACFTDAPTGDLYQHTPLHLTLAMIEIGRLQPDAALEHLKRVISETSTSEFWGRLRIVEAQIDLLRGYSGIATARLDLAMAKMKELPPVNPLDAAGLTMVRSALLLARGNVTRAGANLGKSSSKKAASRIARARLALSLNQPAEVVEILSPVTRYETSLQALHSLVLMTVARLHMEEKDSLRADIEKISGAVATLKNQWPLALLPKTELELLMSVWRELGIPEPETPAPADARIPAALLRITLTPREASILATLATVSDRAEIARLHFVSLNTIKSQLRSLYKKLGVGTREAALLVAQREHLLDN